MPDPSAFDRGAMLVLENPYRGNGGIVHSSKYRGLIVEIRPRKWKKKIWIGKLETYERAQYVADAVYHYLGMSPFHFEKGVMTLPVISCIGTVIGTPVELSTQEMCASYVREIAKGENFKPQRADFILKVKNVVMAPDFPVLAPPQTEVAPEVVVLDDDDRDREDELVCDEDAVRALLMSSHSGSSGVPVAVLRTHVAGPEVAPEVVVLDDDDRDREDELVCDEDAVRALLMSSHSGSSGVPVAVLRTHVAGPNSVGGSEGVQAYVPSFGVDSNGSENILRSTGQSINAIVFSIDDCPTTSSEDEKIWIEYIEELDKRTAVGASTPSVAFNDGEICRDGYETSPILNIPLIVRPCTSTSSKFFGTPVERAVPVGTALGSSSDWPSSQFAMNAKRQKIGD